MMRSVGYTPIKKILLIRRLKMTVDELTEMYGLEWVDYVEYLED